MWLTRSISLVTPLLSSPPWSISSTSISSRQRHRHLRDPRYRRHFHQHHQHHHHHEWTHLTVEWSPRIAKLYEDNNTFADLPTTHFVFPDLPNIYTPEHRSRYFKLIPPKQRIQTLAVCNHETWQSFVKTAKDRLLGNIDGSDDDGDEASNAFISNLHGGKLLIVGGNNKNGATIKVSTEQAVKILRSELGATVELWAVADPNDPDSPQRVSAKVNSGVDGFLTQPLLGSLAWDTLFSYEMGDASLVVGMACPRSSDQLRFWQQLLDRPELLNDDPLFQSHLEYFSRSEHSSSAAWIRNEVQQCFTNSKTNGVGNSIHGIHFMPLRNVEDLVAVLGSLDVPQQKKLNGQVEWQP